VDLDGRFQGTLALIGGDTGGTPVTAQNLDWEDMASVTLDGKPYLVFADIGDNNAFRPNLTLYVVEEPDVSALARPFTVSVTPAWTLTLSYPDGPRDCEGLALDAATGSLFLISKRDAQPMLYSASLRPPVQLPSMPGVPAVPLASAVPLQNLGAINIPRAAAGAPNPESINWVTSFDINQTQTEALVLTLSKVYRYRRRGSESWFAALSRAPEAIAIPQYSQTEAISYSSSGRSFFITSENLPAPLTEILLP
jgi:hypothetical protein